MLVYEYIFCIIIVRLHSSSMKGRVFMFSFIKNKNLSAKRVACNNTERREPLETVRLNRENIKTAKHRNSTGDAGESTPQQKILSLKTDDA